MVDIMSYFGVIGGVNDSGDKVNVAATPEGHLEVAIHSPITAFGEVRTSQDAPVFQTDAVYGLNPYETGTFAETVAARAVTGTATYVVAGLNTREDN